MTSHQEAPTAPRRPRALWWAGGAGVALATALATGWAFRLPLAQTAAQNALSTRGAPADLTVTQLDFGGVTLADVTLGDPAAPDFTAGVVDVRFRWGWTGATPAGVAVQGARLRGTVDAAGARFGAVDLLLPEGEGARPAIPDWSLSLHDVEITVETPAGVLTVSPSAQGRLRQDFALTAPVRLVAAGGQRLEGRLAANATPEGLRLTLAAEGAIAAHGLAAEGVSLSLEAAGQHTLETIQLTGALSAAGAEAANAVAEGLALSLTAGLTIDETGWRSASGPLALAGGADLLRAPGLALAGVQLSSDPELGPQGVSGPWRIAAQTATVANALAGAARAEGALSWPMGGGETGLGATVALSLSSGRLTEDGLAAMRRAWPTMGGLPPGPLSAAALEGTRAALADFALQAPLQLTLSSGLAVALTGPLRLEGAQATRLTFAPSGDFGRGPDGAWAGQGVLALTQGGAARATFRLERLAGGGPTPLSAAGVLQLPDWQASGARLEAGAYQIGFEASSDAGQRVSIAGGLALTGPAPGGTVGNLRLPLAITAQRTAEGGLVIRQAACAPVAIGALALPGLALENAAASLCDRPEGLYRQGADGARAGGFTLTGLRAGGALAGAAAEPVALSAGPISAGWGGGPGRLSLQFTVEAFDLAAEFSPSRQVRAQLAAADGLFVSDADGWRIDGGFSGGAVQDGALNAEISAIAGRWAARPDEAGAVLSLTDATLRIADRPPAGADARWRPNFNPLRVRQGEAVLRGGVIDARGQIHLDDQGERLGGFVAEHRLDGMTGEADIRAEGLVFARERRPGPALTPADVTPQALGVISAMQGRMDATAQVRWGPSGVAASGESRFEIESLTTRTLPIIEGVRGAVVFDDLFAFSTPPGQTVAIDTINPGVALRNGAVRFQLRPGGVVQVESADWALAGGRLQLEPIALRLGADETLLQFQLTEVDLAALVEELSIPDLTATGRVTGVFPVRLTPASAEIIDGRLRSQPGGGTLAYTGAAGQAAEGVARLAFEALENFRYDELEVTLSGDLSDEMDSEVRFSGLHVGGELDLSPVLRLPGAPDVTAPEVPFRFNIAINAPFRSLGDSASMIVDPLRAVERHNDGERMPVDQPPEGPR